MAKNRVAFRIEWLTPGLDDNWSWASTLDLAEAIIANLPRGSNWVIYQHKIKFIDTGIAGEYKDSIG